MAGNEQEDGFFSAATGAMGCTEDLLGFEIPAVFLRISCWSQREQQLF